MDFLIFPGSVFREGGQENGSIKCHEDTVRLSYIYLRGGEGRNFDSYTGRTEDSQTSDASGSDGPTQYCKKHDCNGNMNIVAFVRRPDRVFVV